MCAGNKRQRMPIRVPAYVMVSQKTRAVHFGDEMYALGDERYTAAVEQIMTGPGGLLRQEDLGGKGTVLAAPADIALIPLNDGIYAH